MWKSMRVSRLLLGSFERALTCSRFLSSVSKPIKRKPGDYVHGLTLEKIKNNPVLAEYIAANYPDVILDYENEKLEDDTASLEGRSSESTDGLTAKMNDEDTVQYPLNIRPLITYRRDPVNEEGTSRCNKLRWEGLIPGIIFGGDPTKGVHSHSHPESKIMCKTPWNVIESELDRYHRSFQSRVYDLTVLEGPDDDSEGTVHRVTPKHVQRHPVESSIYCANFLRYYPGRPIKIPVVYINEEESPALKRDGFIIPLQKFIECFIDDGAAIPERLELECTGLLFKEVIRLDRIQRPEGVRFSDRVIKRGKEFVIGVVHGRGRGANEE